VAPVARSGVSASAAYALLVAGALLCMALIDDAARSGRPRADTLFWVALLVMFLPAAWLVCMQHRRAGERLQVLLLLAAGLYVAKILHSPSQFTFHDELVTWRSTQDLAGTGRLFTANPVVKAFPLYPGVELAALALSRVSGLGLFPAGLVVIGVAKVASAGALYDLFRRTAMSSRAAGIAVLVYVANPNFIFFDAQFSYESFSLPFAIVALAAAARAVDTEQAPVRRALTALACLAALAVTASHHLTSYALAAVLLAWTALLLARRRREPATRWTPAAATAATSALSVLAWLLLVGHKVSEYLSPVLGGAVTSTFNLLTGVSSGRTPFQAGGGPANSSLEQAFGVASVVLLLGLLAVGLWHVRSERPRPPLMTLLVCGAALYPLTLALRLTRAGAETSNRASEFVFIGLGATIGVTLAAGLHEGRLAHLRCRALVAVLLAVLFVGGAVIGWGPSARLPGPALVEADTRSVEPYDLAAARWAGAHLPAGSRIVADRENATLMAAYSRLDPQVGRIHRLYVASLITSPTFGPAQELVLRQDEIRFVVVDRRLARERPVVGYYVESKEPEAFTRRASLSPAAMTKFEGVPGLARIYDNGQVAIYEVLR
jgi:hypothetical protein